MLFIDYRGYTYFRGNIILVHLVSQINIPGRIGGFLRLNEDNLTPMLPKLKKITLL